MRITRRRILLAASALAVVALAAIALRPKPLAVEVALVDTGPLRVTVDEEGRTRVRDRFTVASPVTGRVERIALREGDAVRAGDVVARVAPAPLDPSNRAQGEARLLAARELHRSASSRVAEARAAADQERRSMQRYEALLAAGAIAQEQMERVRLASRAAQEGLSAAQAQARAAAADVDGARAALLGGSAPEHAGGRSTIAVRAPSAGQVLRIPDPSERVVMAGTPLLEIGDAGATEVVVDLLSEDAVRLRRGATVEVVDWGGERPLTGTLRRIEPAAVTKVSALGVEEQRVNALIDVRDDAAVLGDGFRVEVRILAWESPRVLLAPSSAVFQEGSRWIAYVVEDGRARRRTIQVGHRGSAQVEVLTGLTPGDRVIVFPSDDVKDGVRVTPR